MTIKTVNCLMHRDWHDDDAKDDAVNGHAPHVFRLGWRRRPVRCRGSERPNPWTAPSLATLARRGLGRNISIGELIAPERER